MEVQIFIKIWAGCSRPEKINKRLGRYMPRPKKNGLDYFPLDVDIFTDDKLKYVRARFEEKGELITIKLLCEIYRNGYYTEWNEDKSLIFADSAGKNITANLANDVVHELVKRGFFDKGIFDRFQILSSRGIQKRFIKVTTERKDVEITADYWLIDLPENTKTTTYIIYRTVNEVNRTGNEVNRPISTQSKVKESKEDTPPDPPLGGNEGGDFENIKKIDGDAAFEELCAIYPRANGNEKAKSHYMGFLTNGRKFDGYPVTRLNHWQIYAAVKKFVYDMEQEGRDTDKMPYFSTLFNADMLGYVKKSQAGYEKSMLKKYGEGWQKIRFSYTFAYPKTGRKRKIEVKTE